MILPCKHCDETGWRGRCDCDPDGTHHCRGMGSCGTHPCPACKGEGQYVVTAVTIGNQVSYDRGFLEPIHAEGHKAMTKVGAHPATDDDPEYGGGWVWRTAEEAQAFIDNTELSFTAKVYGLVLPTNWETDVSPEPDPEDGIHRLLTGSILVQLP